MGFQGPGKSQKKGQEDQGGCKGARETPLAGAREEQEEGQQDQGKVKGSEGINPPWPSFCFFPGPPERHHSSLEKASDFQKFLAQDHVNLDMLSTQW